MAVASALTAVLVADPTRLHGSTPIPNENTLLWIVAAIDAGLLLMAALVHWRRWRLGRDPVQYALVLAASMATAALLSIAASVRSGASGGGTTTGSFSQDSPVPSTQFGFATGALVPWIVCSRRRSRPTRWSTSWRAIPSNCVSSYRGWSGRAAYTHGHSQRTALVAMQLGLRLGVDEDTLRAIARGAYLHDVGKISIPDEILNKPGAAYARRAGRYRDASPTWPRSRGTGRDPPGEPHRDPASPRARRRDRISRSSLGHDDSVHRSCRCRCRCLGRG